ncbi:M15 family metallopeptidase [Demequina sp.]|uniref:M15 family metallopeptidase n=1 Tax=Demequina sp. TaxID=2050685 RepID=UPI003D12F26A
MRKMGRAAIGVACAALALSACTPDGEPQPTATVTIESQTTVTTTATPEPSVDPNLVPNPFARPAWLGTEALPVQKNGLAKPGTTPPELTNRQLEPGPSALPDPDSDAWFVTISEVPEDVLARSSWRSECPVKPSELAYVVMPFWGFDNKPHTGEMLINAKWAEKAATVFEYMYEHRFPIEEMHVTTNEEVNGEHFGDQNVTISFECRRTTGGFSTWSAHASGLAIDINPFQNPWQRDGAVFPELASSYTDRTWLRPGMVETQRQIIKEFKNIGWYWGGNWGTLDDWMHFSANNH